MGINTNLALVQSEYEPSLLNVATQYIKKPDGIQNLAIRPALHSIKWAEAAGLGIAASFQGSKKLLSRCSHLLFWIDYPNTVRKFYSSLVELKDSLQRGSLFEVSDKATKVYINTFFTAGLVADALEILGEEGIIPLSEFHIVVLEVIGFLGSIALLLHALYGIQKNIQDLLDAKSGSPEFNLALLKLAAKVCLAVGAIFSMVAFFQAELIASWLILTFGTILLLLTLASHFYEQMVVLNAEKSVAL